MEKIGLVLIAFAAGGVYLLNRVASRLPVRLARLVQWVHALFVDLFSILATFFLHPARYLSSYRNGYGPRNGTPILLVHGYLHDGSAWVYHRRQLAKAGFGPIYTMNLGHPFRSIREYGEKVKKKAAIIEQETNRSDLILIGHSMGGLVSSYYATHVAKAGTVKDVITIGSPLDGTWMAKIGLGPNAREMEIGSSLTREVLQKIKTAEKTRFFHIATRTDQLIIPSHSALVGENRERQFVLDDIGHVTLLFSPRVSQKIITWLAN